MHACINQEHEIVRRLDEVIKIILELNAKLKKIQIDMSVHFTNAECGPTEK